MAKRKGEFKFQNDIKRPLSQPQLETLINEYKNSLKKNPFKELFAENTYDFIHELKRTEYSIGPYKNLSIFEISNRIFSDLVVLDGALKIFKEPNLIGEIKIESIKLALSNMDGFDLEIYASDKTIIHGEAFNVSPSYLKPKLSSTITKLSDSKEVKKAVILINDDAFGESNELRNYLDEKISTNDKIFCYISCKLEDWKAF